MSDYISIHTGTAIDNAISSVINGRAGIQGIISNGTELEPDQNNKILLNVPDISQSTGNSTTATMSQNAITNQLREKANANLLNNYYQKTESYSKTEIDNIISELPKFDIKVVLALPTENISESTIYLVPTSQEEGGLYQEYVYINNRWELLGGQSVDLSDYYNRQTIDRFLDSKLDVGEVTQSVGYNSTKVMSQKAVTDELNDKFDKTSIDNYYNKAETNSLLNDRININKIVQSAGEDTTSVMSQKAITDLLNTKVDKSSIVQTTGDSNTNVMSQNAITENLSVKADRSDLNNYYDKSETYTKIEIDDKITRIPQFNIQVVDELPTTNISTTTVYVVPSSAGGDDIYREYIYSNNEWKLLGSQTVDLSDYYTKEATNSLLSNKIDKTSIVQSSGNSTTNVMSQDSVTDALDGKIDKTSIVQTTGNSTTSVMSQDSVTNSLDAKFDKSSIVQITGNSTTSVMSQNAVTNQLGNKVNISTLNNYYDKSSVNSLLSGKMNDIGYSDVGIWTPKIGTQKEATGEYKDLTFVSYSYQEGQYIKIGKLCHINFCIKVMLTGTFDNVKNYATINGFPFPASRNIRKQALAMMDIGSIPEDSLIPDWYPEPGISFEFRSTSGTHAHVERTNGLVGLEWPQVLGRWMYISGSGTYITDE